MSRYQYDPELEAQFQDPAEAHTYEPVADPKAVLEKQKRASRYSAIALALLIHVILAALAVLITMAVAPEEPPGLIVGTANLAAPQQIKKQEFTQRIVNQKPAQASQKFTNTIAAASATPLAMPVVENFNPDPIDLGTGFGDGDGFGFGGLGDGASGGSFMGVPGSGLHYIFVIDTSTSMKRNIGEKGVSAIRKEMAKAINGLPAAAQFNIICFGNSADAFKKESVRANKAAKEEAVYFMKGYFGDGPFARTRTERWGDQGKGTDGIEYTPIHPDSVSGLKGTSGGSRVDLGLVAAMDRGPTTIFALSDGEPSTAKNGERLELDEIVDLVSVEFKRIYKERPLTINTLSVDGLGEKFLKKISKKFKGKHKNIKPG